MIVSTYLLWNVKTVIKAVSGRYLDVCLVDVLVSCKLLTLKELKNFPPSRDF